MHEWQAGDLVHWEDRTLAHSVSEYDDEGKRPLMHQITGRDLELSL